MRCVRQLSTEAVTVSLELRPHLPKLREQHHIQHLAQIINACRAAGADFVADHALDGYDVIEAPAAEVVFYVDQLLREVMVSWQVRLQIVQSTI